ncbi:MAG: hypothetical protein WCF12_12520 [Propionicimonas sp.]
MAAAVILGTASCMSYGRLPTGAPSTAQGQAALPEGPKELAAGASHSCTLTSTGRARCWGGNFSGQVGNGSITLDIRRPTDILESDAGNASISAGDSGSCMITAAGGVRCWGIRGGAENGAGPADVTGAASRITAVSVGGMHQCAVTRSGGVKCWGDNADGQLGDGTLTTRPAPVAVDGLPGPIRAVSSGMSHNCALTRAGGVVCWGDNSEGQLGNRKEKDSRSPVAVRGLSSGVTALSAGGSHTCAITETGKVRCWGSGRQGQLGVRAAINSRVPVEVVGLAPGTVAVSAGKSHSCAITRAGAVMCWGDNGSGQLGDGTTASSVLPVNVVGLPSEVSTIAAGGRHTCAVTAAGVTCWGANDSGQLGDGTRTDSRVPVAVASANPPALVADTRPINLIYLDTDLDLASGQPREPRKAREAVGRRLRSREPVLLDAIRQGFTGATGGRWKPAWVRVTVAHNTLRLDPGCIDHNYGFNTQGVDDAARPYRKEGAINVIVVEAFDCADNDEQTWAGYDGSDQMPVALWSSLNSVNELLHTVLHEYGHDAGLEHAGAAWCDDPIAIAHCDVEPTADEASLMSYAHTLDVFTEPELDTLHLLTAEEIVRIAPHPDSPLQVALHDPQEPGPKLLILRRAYHKKPLFLSWVDGNLQIRYPFKPADTWPTLVSVSRGTPILGERVFRNAALTVNFVGTDATGNAVLDIIPRSRRAPTPTPSPTAP